MRSPDIRRTFTDFFVARDHRAWPSASLIPNDPSLLLTVAGMVPFKPYFLGEATPGHPRATSVQKCARTNDIENVGLTTRHLTFFEMLGNFSFGDYFKADAIRWAWELSTTPQSGGGFGFDPERIWATIYLDDDEADALWRSETDLPAARIVRRGKEDNYWGNVRPGPCGPCSELYYDRGPEHGLDGGPEADESRYLEFWNLVFMQDLQDAGGTVLGELPAKNVDTGMGMERMAVLLQDVPNVYETDVLRPLLDRAAELTEARYGEVDRQDVSLRVIADHARSSAFLLADGVLPSNEGRGYVLRRLLRRIVRHSRLLEHEGPLMLPMMETVIDHLGPAWPELRTSAELITRLATREEESFTATLRSGLKLLDDAMTEARDAGGRALSATTAFTLHDTYGFPIDLTVEIAEEQGLALDRDEFAQLMEGQRTRARAAARRSEDGSGVSTADYRAAAERTGATTFVGYTEREADTAVGAIVVPGGLDDVADEGELVEVVLARTPFYAEGGGQLGDHGVITTETGRIDVLDTVSPLEGLIVHHGRVVAGEVRTGQDAHAAIDDARRASITRGHTGTHLLHATLREVVGEHAAQAGSAIDAGRFRFDFPAFEPLSPGQLAELEERVNDRIAADPAIETVETSQTEARAMGATALFGEKYGDHVRVVRIGDFSTELCGGTHVGRTSEVGLFTVLSEGSIGSSLRRVEAVTGPDAFRFLSAQRLVADGVAQLLAVPAEEALDRVAGLVGRVRDLEKELARQRRQALLGSAAALLDAAESADGTRIVAATVDAADRDALKALALDLRQRAGSGAGGSDVVVLLGSAAETGGLLFVAVSPALDLSAADVLRAAAEAGGGRGGGRGDTAQGGIPDAGRLGAAIDAGRRAAREAVSRAGTS